MTNYMAAMTTKHRMIDALLNGDELRSLGGELLFRNVTKVEREDGSGKSWNVTGYVARGNEKTGALFAPMTKHVRTVD